MIFSLGVEGVALGAIWTRGSILEGETKIARGLGEDEEIHDRRMEAAVAICRVNEIPKPVNTDD